MIQLPRWYYEVSETNSMVGISNLLTKVLLFLQALEQNLVIRTQGGRLEKYTIKLINQEEYIILL